jgi:acyl-CoA hydrolase
MGDADDTWRSRLSSTDTVLKRVRPGMRIFLSTGLAEPRTFVKSLMGANSANLTDLELIQLVSLSQTIAPQELRGQKYRLKTFFPGKSAHGRVTEGAVDLIPSRFGRIAPLFKSGRIAVDMAVLQVTPPDASGYCSLGVSVDVGRIAMSQAALSVGEINPRVPFTFGDTLVAAEDFDLLMEGTEMPMHLNRPAVHGAYDTLAANVAGLVEDGCCIAFSFGPLYEALAVHLAERRHLGVHSPFMTDALMDLIKSGAVSNRRKGVFHGRSAAAYAIGSRTLMGWLDRNPLVEFHAIERVFNPAMIGRNPHFTAIYPAKAVDLSGQVLLRAGERYAGTGSAEVLDFCSGAEIAPYGRTIFALPSRSPGGRPSIRVSVARGRHPFGLKGSVDLVVTEFGVADLGGRSVRERAQAIIDIAHPDDRAALIEGAKKAGLLYRDQIYLAGSGRLYPSEIHVTHTFKNGQAIRFRPIRPSDEEGMRRLFYRFSNEAVYYRYFTPLRSMPHGRMQAYVNVDWTTTMAIVGLVGPTGQGRIVAEGRFVRELHRPLADLVFLVDPDQQGAGVASFLYRMLADLALQRGLKGFTAEVLFSNQAMMKVFRNGPYPVKAVLENGIYYLTIPFESPGKPLRKR